MTAYSRQQFLLGLSIGLSFLLALAPIQSALAISVVEVPNPQRIDGTWVTDMANMLSNRTETDLNQMLSALETTNGAEVAVVTVPNTQGASSPKAFATELFNTWGIGKAGLDNGVLFLISKGDRRNEIETGYGVEGILPDAKLGAILDRQVTPQFKSGNFDAGVLSGTEAIVIALGGEGLATSGSIQPLASGPGASPARPSQPVSGQSTPYIPPAKSSGPINTDVLNGLRLLLIAAIAPIVIALKPLRTGKFPPVKLAPTGKTKLAHMEGSGCYLWTMRWATIGLSLKDFTGLKRFFKRSFYEKMTERFAALSSWQLVYQRNKQFNLTAGALFFLLTGLSVAALKLEGRAILWVPLAAWCWLTGELAAYHHSKETPAATATKKTLVSLGLVTLCTLIIWAPFALFLSDVSFMMIMTLFATAIVFIIGIFYIAQATGGWRRAVVGLAGLFVPVYLVWFGWGLLASPFLLTLVFGLLAGLIRLLRVSETLDKVDCETCDRSLQRLTKDRLRPYLTDPQQAEGRIHSKQYEGWWCPVCSPPTLTYSPQSAGNVPASNLSGPNLSGPNLSIHLVEFVLNKRDFKTCKACDALTLSTSSTTIRAATYSSSGSRRVSKFCHACKERTERIITIPQKTRSSSSSSGSRSSSSSSHSSGGSFGGGSSGGGGAGSSW